MGSEMCIRDRQGTDFLAASDYAKPSPIDQEHLDEEFVEDFKQMNAGAGKNKLIAVAVCAGLHLWKKNTLLSIIGSTAVYMILVVVCP